MCRLVVNLNQTSSMKMCSAKAILFLKQDVSDRANNINKYNYMNLCMNFLIKNSFMN